MRSKQKTKDNDLQIVIHILLIMIILGGLIAGYIWIPVITMVVEFLFCIVVGVITANDEN